MIFHVQYNDNLLTVNIDKRRKIGQLYGHIINTIHVRSSQVVYMVSGYTFLGLPPIQFETSISSSGLIEYSLIYVVLNHYPDLTQRYCQNGGTNDLFEQWVYADDSFDSNLIDYDPVLSATRPSMSQTSGTQPSVSQPSTTRPSLTQPSVSQPSTTRPSLTQPSVSQPSTTRPSLTQPSVSQPSTTRPSLTQPSTTQPSTTQPSTTQPSTAQPPTRRRLILRRQQEPPQNTHTHSTVSSVSVSNTRETDESDTTDDEPEMGIEIEQEFDINVDSASHSLNDILSASLNSFGNENFRNNILNAMNQALSMVGRTHNLTPVPVTLSEQQFRKLEKGHYKDVVSSYKRHHLNEEPYPKCPITQETFSETSNIVMLGCGHYFSEEGIKTWLLEQSVKCPCCNADVREFLTH
jgi:hypothetical protein